MALVTLSSDLGWAYAAQMKAVLFRSLPLGSVVDLAHDLPAHGVAESAFLLREMARRFPAGSIHVAVVDPGVGGPRAPVAVRLRDGTHLVGPDNGLLYPLAHERGVERSVRLDPRQLGPRGRIGTTFDGRDLFAPAAVALALGNPVEQLGRPHRLLSLRIAVPRHGAGVARGAILHVDHFGNLITNFPSSWLPDRRTRVTVRIARGAPVPLRTARSYHRLGAGSLGLLPSSFGLLELCLREANAAEHLGAATGDPLELRWRSGPKDRK